ncbi:MAG: LuxR C-terminal-related transcriptional regulator [Rikenellaceae bacterium]
MQRSLHIFLFIIALLLRPTLTIGQEAQTTLSSMLTRAHELQNSNPTLSLYYCNEGIKTLHELERSKGSGSMEDINIKAELFLQSGVTCRLLGDFDSALTYLHSALDSTPEENLKLRASIDAEMSRAYCFLSDFNKAIELNDRATSTFKALGDSISLAACYNSKGIIECHVYEYDKADLLFKRSLEINRQYKLLKEVAANLNNLALYKGNAEEKIAYLHEAIAINKNLDSKWSLAENYNNLGRQYYFDSQFDKAIESLNLARQTADEIEAKALICDNCEYRAELYFKMGNYKEAYENLSQLHSLSQEVGTYNKLRTIEQRIFQQKEEQQQREAYLQEIRYKEAHLRQRVTTFAILAIFGALFTILLYRRRQYKRNAEHMQTKYDLVQAELELDDLRLNKQKMELESVQKAFEASQKEAISFSAFVQCRTELLSKIRSMIKQCERMKSVDEIHRNLSSAGLFISQYMGGEGGQNALLVGVDARNEEFADRLSAKHPALTSGERRLASLLRIDLSTKDISVLMGISPKTVNMNRYRLRKSLELDSEIDLVEYIKGL